MLAPGTPSGIRPTCAILPAVRKQAHRAVNMRSQGSRGKRAKSTWTLGEHKHDGSGQLIIPGIATLFGVPCTDHTITVARVWPAESSREQERLRSVPLSRPDQGHRCAGRFHDFMFRWRTGGTPLLPPDPLSGVRTGGNHIEQMATSSERLNALNREGTAHIPVSGNGAKRGMLMRIRLLSCGICKP
jgi:hypothetical protein